MSNTPEVSILTFAYNAEKYIRKCADSILGQTFSNIEWIVIDNGSTDATGKILSEYEKNDTRVRLYRNNENSRKENADCKYIDYFDLFSLVRGNYFTTLDSDDFFELNFVAEMIELARKTDADMVICGNNFIPESTGKITGYRVPPDFIGNVSELCQRLPEFYACLRPMWERLYKTETFRQNEGYLRIHGNSLRNGGDTFMNLKFLQVSNRVASINKVLHNYLIREDSVYHSRIYLDRWKSYDLIFIEGLSLLTQYSAATPENISFLSAVLINSLMDLIDVGKRSESASDTDRIRFLLSSATSPMLALCINYIPRETVSNYLYRLFQTMWPIIKSAIIADELDTDLKWEILNFLNKINGKEHIIDAIMMGKILSASLEDQDQYIAYCKMLIAFYIENNNFSEAKKEFLDLYEILPDDPDLQRYTALFT